MEQEKPIEIKLCKPVDFQKQFIANGRVYTVSETISIARWAEYEKLVPRLTYGIGFDEINKAHRKAWDFVNDRRFGDAAVVLHNLMSGIKDADNEERVHPALLMCTLIINYEGEDTTVFSKEVQLQKIADWKAEGLDILSFFAFALRCINGFKETYLAYIAEAAEMVERSALTQKKK